mgnify:CR=1 FL=1
MKRRTNRAASRAHKKALKEAGMKRPGATSNYAKKKAWCARNGVFGFEVLSPKPWK